MLDGSNKGYIQEICLIKCYMKEFMVSQLN